MSRRAQLVLSIGVVAVLLLIFFSYGLYKSKDYLLGPRIYLESPTDGESFTSSLIEIKGQAINISALYLNGGQIFTDEQGNFKEEILLAKGLNIIEVKADDKFGRSVKQIRNLVLK